MFRPRRAGGSAWVGPVDRVGVAVSCWSRCANGLHGLQGESVAVRDETRIEEALGWLSGPAAGSILPTDVTARLGADDQRSAPLVLELWSQVYPRLIGGQVLLPRQRRARGDP